MDDRDICFFIAALISVHTLKPVCKIEWNYVQNLHRLLQCSFKVINKENTKIIPLVENDI